MKRFILAASIFSVWLAIASTYYMCVIKGMCGGSDSTTIVTETPKVTKPAIVKKEPIAAPVQKIKDTLAIAEETTTTIDTLKSAGLKIYDKDFLLKSYFGNFKIYKDKPQVTIAFSISEYGYVLAKHMDSVNSTLSIKGYHNQEETTEKGLQRADFVKDRLIKLGIPENLITTVSQPAIYDYNYNKFTGGIEFNFKKLDTLLNINTIDYSLFNNSKKVAVNNVTPPQQVIQEATPSKPEPNISDSEIKAITKTTPKETAKAAITPTPSKTKKENISFTVTEKYFKNNKFKASKSFKKFMKTHKGSPNLKLIGYSNANKNTNDNYNKGLELVNLVNSYLLNEGIYNGKATTQALKGQKFSSENTIKEGVTLIIN